MNSSLPSPWALAGIVPGLPVRAARAVDASAAPRSGVAVTPAAVHLVAPWTADAVRLPARADALPMLATAPLVPVPRPQADVIDLREAVGLRR